MRPNRSFLLAWLAPFALLALSAAGGWAQEAVKTLDLADSVTIVRVDWLAGELIVADTEGRNIDVRVDEDTQVLLGAEPVPPVKLGVGDRIVIEARRQGGGEASDGPMVADRVLIVVDPGPQPVRNQTIGRVLSTDAVERTITVATSGTPDPVIFRVPEDDAVSIAGAPASLAEIEMADRVEIVHDDDARQATAVRVERMGLRAPPQGESGEPVIREE